MSTTGRHIAEARWAALLLVLALLAGCYTYVFLPGEVSYETVSPPYVLQIVNRTGGPFSVEPSAYGNEKGFAPQRVPEGASFDVLMQVRRFRIGDRDRTGAHQVLDGPYIAQQGANTAVIRLRHNELYFLAIDLESERWFAARATSEPVASPLTIEIESFEPKRWLLTGPP